MSFRFLRKKTVYILSAVLLAVFLLLASVVSYAYFSTRARVVTPDGQEYAKLGMKLSLLFDIINSDEALPAVADGTSLNIVKSYDPDGNPTEYYTYNSQAEWGSAENPYIISDIRHLQNLSVLQEIGYFDELYISKNFDDAGTYQNTAVMPYFLICKPDGSPATIQGTGVTLSPIGTEDFPFIGYVGGAFTPGETTVGTEDLSSDVSALYDLSVAATTDLTDVGLFGVIGFLGTEPANQTDAFSGAVSTVKDMLLYDVKIKVENPSWAETLIHRFTYSILSDTDENYNKVPHENHHIGILAGHVEYAEVEFISVYYSSEQIAAIDLLHTQNSSDTNKEPNYASTTGIIGFLHNMNPTYIDGRVSAGSGTSSSEISVGTGGAGSGGGLISGTGSGYVTAEGIYRGYTYTSENRQNGQPVWEFTVGEETAVRYGIMVHRNADGYYLEDDITPVTVSNGTASAGGNTWSDYIVRTGTEDNYRYYYKEDPQQEVTDFRQRELVIRYGINEKGEPLCTEWVRQTLLWGTQNTGRYYFYDGVFTFALSDNADGIEDTWKNDAPDSFTIGEDDPAQWKSNTSKGNKAVVAYLKEIVTEADLQAAIAAGKHIFIGHHAAYDANTPISRAETNLNLISLYETTGSSAGNIFDDFFTMDALSKNFVSDEMRDGIVESLTNGGYPLPEGLDLEQVKNGTVKVLNLGSSEDLAMLNQQFRIVASQNGQNYVLKDSVNDYYLSILKNSINTAFSIWCGNDSSLPSSIFGKYTYEKNAVLNFSNNAVDPSLTVSYSMTYTSWGSQRTVTRYVNYNATEFNGVSAANGNTTNMYLYTVEATQNIDFGRITFDPREGTKQQAFNADEYVLWPNSTLTQTANGAGESASSSVSADPSYTVKSLQELYEENNGWKNSLGEPLTKNDLHKKFRMTREIDWSVNLNIGNSTLEIGDGSLRAPVGTLGTEANIPRGSVAFRINKGGEQKIRVIVAVPQTEYYRTESDYDLDWNEDYYFGVWQVPEAGSSFLQVFSKNSALEKFELPRSNPYEPGTAPNAEFSNHIQTLYNGETYRCYLNGDRVLVAYEFTVNGEGVYILGTTKGPMEIVYFSADATASSGRDGTSGSQIGSIDFVYSYDGSVVTVKETSDTDGPEDYHSYYASLCLLYTDNAYDPEKDLIFPGIKDFQVYVRRKIETGESSAECSKMVVTVGSSDADLIQLARYSRVADEVERKANAPRQ